MELTSISWRFLRARAPQTNQSRPTTTQPMLGKKGKVEKKHLSNLDLKTLEKRINELRVMMKQASRELRFEDAAKIRDEIKSLSEARLLL